MSIIDKLIFENSDNESNFSFFLFIFFFSFNPSIANLSIEQSIIFNNSLSNKSQLALIRNSSFNF